MKKVVNDIVAHVEHNQSQFGPTMRVRSRSQDGNTDSYEHFSAPFRFNHASKEWFIAGFAFSSSEKLARFLTPWFIEDACGEIWNSDLRIFTVIDGCDPVEFPHNEVSAVLDTGHNEENIDDDYMYALQLLLEKMKCLVA